MPQERLPNALYQRGDHLPNGLWELLCWRSDDLPDGTEVTDVREGWQLGWTASATDQGLIQVTLADFSLGDEFNAWFVAVEEPKASPRAVNLVVFVGDERPMGTIVSKYAFATMGVQNDRQVGAIRWYPQNGLVHQVFVGQEWRRNRMATYLMWTASAFHHANGWPGILHGDGRRTTLGDFLVDASGYPDRFGPLEARMPPMDPPADA